MLKVSIITAVRNGVDAIKSTMDSVGSQTYRNIEYVIIDGASTDGTVEYINSRRQDAAVFRSEKDDGVYDAFNRGLLVATGDVVGFLNAGDTFAHAEAVARIMGPLNSGAAEAVFGDVALTDIEDDTRTLRLYRSQYFRPTRPYIQDCRRLRVDTASLRQTTDALQVFGRNIGSNAGRRIE